MIIFVSTPMSGKTNDEILKSFERIKDLVKEQFDPKEPIIISNDFITPYIINTNDAKENTIPSDLFVAYGDPDGIYENLGPVGCLGNSIMHMPISQAIIFTRGFTQARGCLVEYTVVNNYGDDWVKDPKKPNVYFEMPDGTLKEATNRLERHRCFMMDQMDD